MDSRSCPCVGSGSTGSFATEVFLVGGANDSRDLKREFPVVTLFANLFGAWCSFVASLISASESQLRKRVMVSKLKLTLMSLSHFWEILPPRRLYLRPT